MTAKTISTDIKVKVMGDNFRTKTEILKVVWKNITKVNERKELSERIFSNETPDGEKVISEDALFDVIREIVVNIPNLTDDEGNSVQFSVDALDEYVLNDIDRCAAMIETCTGVLFTRHKYQQKN